MAVGLITQAVTIVSGLVAAACLLLVRHAAYRPCYARIPHRSPADASAAGLLARTHAAQMVCKPDGPADVTAINRIKRNAHVRNTRKMAHRHLPELTKCSHVRRRHAVHRVSQLSIRINIKNT